MLAALCNFLIQWAQLLGVKIINFLIDVINASIVAIVALITLIASLFPAGSILPTLDVTPSDSTWIAAIHALNWFFPFGFIVQIFSFVTGSLIAYAAIAPLARWAKLLR